MSSHLAFTVLVCLAAPAEDPASTRPYTPKVLPASSEALLAIRGMPAPPGFRVELFAAEPLLANPVAFCIDGQGRFYVAETFRIHAGVDDTRENMYWLDDDLAARTVEDNADSRYRASQAARDRRGSSPCPGYA